MGTLLSIHRNPQQGKRHRVADHSRRGQGRHAGGGAQAFPHRRGHGGGFRRKGSHPDLRRSPGGQRSRRPSARNFAGSRARGQAGCRNGLRGSVSQAHRSAGAHLRAGPLQTGDPAKGPRGRARKHLFRIFGPRGRAGHLHREAPGRPGSGRRSRQDRGPAAEKRAVQAGKFQRGRPHPVHHQERRKGRQERGCDHLARRAGAGDAPVRAGSAGDLRQHRDHQGLRAGSRRAHQDRRLQPRPRECRQRAGACAWV